MARPSVNFFNYRKLHEGKVKKLIEFLEKSYDCDCSHLKNYYFYINNANKVYISSVEVDSLKIKRVNMVGLYFGTFHDEERFRLSIDGSKFVKPKKNFVKISDEVLKSYISAENLFVDEVEINSDKSAPFLIVVNNSENIGCVSKKDKFLLNYVPKSRKLDYNKVF